MSSVSPSSATTERPDARPDERASGLSVSMRAYVVAVAVLGHLLALLLLGVGFDEIHRANALAVILLTALAALATRIPLQIRYRTHVYIVGAVYLAMVLSLPLSLPAILALVSTVIGNVGRHRDRLEAAFNRGQFALHVAGSALIFALLRDREWLGPSVAGLGSVGAVVITAVFGFLLNSGLVSIATALHGGRNPIRVWFRGLENDYQVEGTLVGIGIVGGTLAAHYPVTLPLLAFPFVLLHRALENVTRLRSDTFAALVKLNEVVEISDPYTAGHSVRVGEMSRTIALRMNLTVEEADEVGSAGGVHDVGKIGIDPAILTKSDRLEPWEMEQMKLHPSLGADIVARFTTSGPIPAYVRHHHEWLNGSGYPDGLAGEAIPVGARIIAVADTYDALTSKRPYRDPLSPTEALLVLRDGAGNQWDAAVVAAMFAHARSLGIPFPKAPEPSPLRMTDLSPA